MNEQDEHQLRELLQLKSNNNQSYDLSEQPSFYASSKNLQNFFQTPQPHKLQQKFFHDSILPSGNSLNKNSTSSLFKEELSALKASIHDLSDATALVSQLPSCFPQEVVGEYLELRQSFLEGNAELVSHRPRFQIIFLCESKEEFFEGEVKDGKFNGIGGRIFKNRDIYFGEWKSGEMNGKGVYKFYEHALYEIYYGKFQEGVCSGVGKYQLHDGRTYEGTTKNWELTGIGKLCNPDGSFYRGELLRGMPHGIGYQMLPDSTQYEGDFLNGERHGKGKLTSKGNNNTFTLYTGEFVDGKIQGQGVMIWPNGNCYDGAWANGVMHGKGKYLWANGQVYTGFYFKGIKSGQGQIEFPNGKKFRGEFKNGQIHGSGVFISKKGGQERHHWQDGVMQRTSQQLYKEF